MLPSDPTQQCFVLQAGYVCLGVCEKDAYCKAVLRKHYPDVPICDDLHALDLAKMCAGVRLDVLVITTPCVDLSSRGLGLAQLGEVCSRPAVIQPDDFLHRHSCVFQSLSSCRSQTYIL